MGKTSRKQLRGRRLTLTRGHVHLEKFLVGIDLIFNQIGWLDNFLELTEIDAL